jgi:VTC domain
MLREPESDRLAASARWQAILGRYAPAGLADVAETAVANRTDTKFLLHDEQLWSILAGFGDRYRVLDIDGRRFTGYQTQYFDTESFALFRRHHAGGANRCKVRTRLYDNTGLSFLEVKQKTRTGATTKFRVATAKFETKTVAPWSEFLAAHCPYPATALGPVLRSRFDRICLISSERAERLTIDLDLKVDGTAGTVDLPNIAVAEIKQEWHGDAARNSEFLRAMRATGIRSTSFSKYCIGLLLTRPEIKHNLFKPQLKQLRHLMGETNAVA